MAVFDKLQSTLDKSIAPLATKLGSSEMLKSLSGGMMATMPVSLGVALLAIAINLPIPGWTDLIASSGISAVANEVLAVTMNMLALYLVYCISSRYGKAKGLSEMTAAVMTLGVFLVLMPMTVEANDYGATYFINSTYLGSNGIFMAIILGILVPAVISFLMKHVSIKMPDSVPPMVTDSLSPTFAAIILFTGAFFVKWGLTFTPWGNLFDMVNTIVAAPIMNVGSSPLALIFVYTFASLLWFFGVHPSAITNVYMPVMITCMMANIQAIIAGQPLPYLTWQVVYMVTMLGGTGEGIGVALSALTAKSERYKAVSRLVIVPALFNISEPLMFGLPVVLNPSFLVPFVLATPVCGFAAWGLSELGLAASLNPAISMPWVMPWPITAFFQGGFGALVIILVCIALATLIYLPFFKTADRMALKEEQAAAAGEEV